MFTFFEGLRLWALKKPGGLARAAMLVGCDTSLNPSHLATAEVRETNGSESRIIEHFMRRLIEEDRKLYSKESPSACSSDESPQNSMIVNQGAMSMNFGLDILD